MISLLFTDVESSTQLADRVPFLYDQVLARHFEILRRCLRNHDGHEFLENGDGLLLAFSSVSTAAAFAIEAQRCLSEELWPEKTGALKVRMALHTGEAEFRDGQYRGLAMNLTARLLSAAHGGQVLCSEGAVQALGALSPAPLRVLGLFRLRGFERGQEIRELLWRDDLTFHQLRAEHARSHNLPPIQTPIIGRDSERITLRKWLDPDQEGVRLVTLTGMGGIGKTRLAIEVARDLLNSFNHAIALVSLVDIDKASHITESVRRALKIPAQPPFTALEQIKEAFGTRNVLLVLDNLEQLLPEGVAYVQALLREIPGLRCLVTSRIGLGLPGERVLQVAPLGTPKQANSSTDLSSSSELFIQCARAVRPEFQITDANRQDLIQLSNLLEGVPLAIELAAARISVLLLSQILTQIEDRFTLLRKQLHEHHERHSSLEAAIHWSYNALPRKSRQVLASLSVFVGGFSLDAATQVVGEGAVEETQAALQNLRFCSLLTVEESVSGLRFRILETIRHYAADQLDDETGAVLERHWRYFSTLAYKIEAQLEYKVDTLELDQFEEEHPNFLQVLAHSANPIRRLRLATALHRFWQLRGYARENRRWFNRVPAYTDNRERDVVARALHAGAILDLSLMRPWRAHVFFQKAYWLYEEMGMESCAAGALLNMGQITFLRSDYKAAKMHFLKCVKIFEQLGQAPQLGVALTALGVCYLEEDEIETARPLLHRSLLLLKDSKNRANYAIALQNYGYLEFCANNPMQSWHYYSDSLVIHRELQMISNISILYISVARLAVLFRQFEVATRLFSAAMLVKRKIGQRLSNNMEVIVLDLKANICIALGEHTFIRVAEEIKLLGMREILNLPIDLS